MKMYAQDAFNFAKLQKYVKYTRTNINKYLYIL